MARLSLSRLDNILRWLNFSIIFLNFHDFSTFLARISLSILSVFYFIILVRYITLKNTFNYIFFLINCEVFNILVIYFLVSQIKNYKQRQPTFTMASSALPSPSLNPTFHFESNQNPHLLLPFDLPTSFCQSIFRGHVERSLCVESISLYNKVSWLLLRH